MHDKNGKELKKGDRVTVEAEIVEVGEEPEYCNVQLRISERGQEPGPLNVVSIVHVNTKQTVLIEQA